MRKSRLGRPVPHGIWVWCALIATAFCFGQLGSLSDRASPNTLQYVTYAHRILSEDEISARPGFPLVLAVFIALLGLTNPWPRFLLLGEHFWRAWLAGQASSPLLLVCLAVAVWGSWRWTDRSVGLLVLALGATGVANETVHPLLEIGERMIITLWLLPVLGLALAIDVMARSTKDSTAGAEPLIARERAPGATVSAAVSGCSGGTAEKGRFHHGPVLERHRTGVRHLTQ